MLPYALEAVYWKFSSALGGWLSDALHLFRCQNLILSSFAAAFESVFLRVAVGWSSAVLNEQYFSDTLRRGQIGQQLCACVEAERLIAITCHMAKRQA